jgi:hypothetical protein
VDRRSRVSAVFFVHRIKYKKSPAPTAGEMKLQFREALDAEDLLE